jgi:hypothetical protein
MHDTPELQSRHVSKSYCPHCAMLVSLQPLVVHSSTHGDPHAPLLHVSAPLHGTDGLHSLQPSWFESPHVITPVPLHCVSPRAHSSTHTGAQRPAEHVSPSLHACAGPHSRHVSPSNCPHARITPGPSHRDSPVAHSSTHVARQLPSEQNGADVHAAGALHIMQPSVSRSQVTTLSPSHCVAPSTHQSPHGNSESVTAPSTCAPSIVITSVVPAARRRPDFMPSMRTCTIVSAQSSGTTTSTLCDGLPSPTCSSASPPTSLAVTPKRVSDHVSSYVTARRIVVSSDPHAARRAMSARYFTGASNVPEAQCMNVTDGGVASPEKATPQHAAAPFARIEQLNSGPALTATKEPVGIGSYLPQHVRSPFVFTPHE